jgi:hypothetical protein
MQEFEASTIAFFFRDPDFIKEKRVELKRIHNSEDEKVADLYTLITYHLEKFIVHQLVKFFNFIVSSRVLIIMFFFAKVGQ